MASTYRLIPLRSLGGQIMSILGMAELSILVIFSLSVFYFVNRSESEAWQGRQSEAARNAAGTVSAFIQRVRDALLVVGIVEPDHLVDDPQELETLLSENTALLEILRLDPDGHVMAASSRQKPVLAELITIPQSQWFLAARAGGTYIGNVQLSTENDPYLIMAVPTLNGGVVAARVQMDVLWKVVRNIRFGDRGQAYVITQTGRLVGHTDPSFVLSSTSIAGRPEFLAMLAQPGQEWSGSYTNFQGEQVVGYTSLIQGTNWLIVTELPASEAYRSTRSAIWTLGALAVTLMAIASLVVARFVRTLVIQPVDELRQGAELVGRGALSHRISEGLQNELGQLAATFNSMAGQLEAQQRDLRQYAEDLEQRVHERTLELSHTNLDLAREVEERKAAEQQVRSSLAEKEVLLKEIHHRVKNNLQVISSLLSLQSGVVLDDTSLQVLRDSQARVRSMALIHELLYQSQGLDKIDFGRYVQDLVIHLYHSYHLAAGQIQLDVRTEAILVDLDQAVPCGLILNELITNALKYAFPDGRTGTLQVYLSRSQLNGIQLQVADNGVGLPAGLDIFRTKSLGWQLIHSLVKQLDGTLTVDRVGGSSFCIAWEA